MTYEEAIRSLFTLMGEHGGVTIGRAECVRFNNYLREPTYDPPECRVWFKIDRIDREGYGHSVYSDNLDDVVAKARAEIEKLLAANPKPAIETVSA